MKCKACKVNDAIGEERVGVGPPDLCVECAELLAADIASQAVVANGGDGNN